MDSIVSSPAPSGHFDLGTVIEKARALIKGSKRYGFLLYLLFAAAFAITGILEVLIFPLYEPVPYWWTFVVSSLIGSILVLTTANFGLHRAAGQPLTFAKLFRHADRLGAVSILYLPLWALTIFLMEHSQIALFVLIVVLAYPAAFMQHFVLDRDLGPLEAIARSFELVLGNLGRFLMVVLLLIGLAALGLVTLGIGLLWIVPFQLVLSGVIYAESVGLASDYG